MTMIYSVLAQASAAEEGASTRSLLDSIPTDPASLFALALTVGSIGLVIWFGRDRGKGDKQE